jgi:putative PIN family toxin of toxin-antitoxin system
LRILLDTNLLARANERSEGLARQLLETVIAQHTLPVSSDMLVELARVLRYPRLRKLFGLTDEEIYHYIGYLREVCRPVSPDSSLPVPMRDPKDIAVLQTAVIGEAEIICTLDSDFYDAETLAFCATCGIEVCTDVTLMNRLQAS